jgi:hypothetical protein
MNENRSKEIMKVLLSEINSAYIKIMKQLIMGIKAKTANVFFASVHNKYTQNENFTYNLYISL